MTAFIHQVRLTIWKPQPGEDSALGSFFGDPVPNSTVIEGLRVQFSVEKDDQSTANKATVSVTNLARSSRADLVTLPRRMILEAGYRDEPLSMLFIGDVSASPGSTYDGIDNVTTFLGKDGGRAIKNAKVSKSFIGPTTALRQVQEAAAAMGLRAPENLALLEELRAEHPHGVALRGLASDALSRLLKPHGLGWSIQDGKLRVAKAGDFAPDEVILIDAAAGLIGSPELSPPTKPGEKPTLTAKCLLFPELTVGRRVEVRSKTATGTFKIKGVKHEGDNMDAEMYTEIEGTPV